MYLHNIKNMDIFFNQILTFKVHLSWKIMQFNVFDHVLFGVRPSVRLYVYMYVFLFPFSVCKKKGEGEGVKEIRQRIYITIGFLCLLEGWVVMTILNINLLKEEPCIKI